MMSKHEGFIAEIPYDDGNKLMRAMLHFAGRNIDEMKKLSPRRLSIIASGAASAWLVLSALHR